MIFISGVHGVGKTYFCNKVSQKLGIKTYSASMLIAEKKKKGFSADKLISDIDINQQYLKCAVDELRTLENSFILDGHFCLLNEKGEITRVPEDTFYELKPDNIILLTEDPNIIAARRKERDGIEYSVEEIQLFQNAEAAYAAEIADMLSIPILISQGKHDADMTLQYIADIVRNKVE